MRKQHDQTTKPTSLVQKSRLERYLELMTRIMCEPLLKYANFSTILKSRFYGLKSLLLTKQYDQTTLPKSLLQKSRLERYLELLTRIMGKPVLKYTIFSTIVHCRFYGIKSLLLTKQHDQKTKRFSLVQKSRLERYLELLTRIMGKPVLKYTIFSTIVHCRFYGIKSLLLTKQHDQKTKRFSLVQKSRLKRYLELMTRIMG